MKMKVEQQEFNENTDQWEKTSKTLNIPDELPAPVGDKADRKLNAEIDLDQKGNNSRDGSQSIQASTTIQSKAFREVTDYLAETMMTDYNRGDSVDMSTVTDDSKKKVAKHYFDQLDPFGSKKKGGE